jgi:hypothetical protein
LIYSSCGSIEQVTERFSSFSSHCGQTVPGFPALFKDLTCFDRPSFTDKAEYLAKDRVHRLPEPNLGLFSQKAAEIIDFGNGEGFGLCWACWEGLCSLHQPPRDLLVMDAEKPANDSHPNPF